MSTPPFMRPVGRRRRRGGLLGRRRVLAGAGALGVAAIVTLLVLAGSTAVHERAPASARRTHLHASSAPALSPAGLELARPAFTLTGLRSPAADALRLSFHHQPRAGLLFDLSSGRVLWQHNALTPLPIASLTKMMTALLSVESAPPSARVLVTRQAIEAGGSKVGELPLGKHVRLETMLYGLMLPSGNDAAIALAQYLAGSVKAFVARMNAQAAKLGMGCTRYSSPSGFYDAGNFSCAADLAMLAHVDLAQPRIARVVHTYSAALPFPIKGGKLYLYNNNPLLIYDYPGTTGLKTGWTLAAGRCLVATAERGGVRLGVVLLDSADPGTQARQLLDRGFHDVYHLARVPEPPMPSGA
jgi:D-alanyl-D-alanine carboxypeptidase (penicillin-binding protein 5/6)